MDPMQRSVRLVVFSLLATLAFASCGDESSKPIDLSVTTTTAANSDADVNAEARQQLEDLAKEECRKDPTREFGVIIIADQETGAEVNRLEFPCETLTE